MRYNRGVLESWHVPPPGRSVAVGRANLIDGSRSSGVDPGANKHWNAAVCESNLEKSGLGLKRRLSFKAVSASPVLKGSKIVVDRGCRVKLESKASLTTEAKSKRES